jgi:hypothetical protein
MRKPPVKLIVASGAFVSALGISAAFVGPVVFASGHSAPSHVRAEALVSAPLFSGVGAIGITLDVRPAPVHLSVAPTKRVVLTAATSKPKGTTETIDGTVESVHGDVIVVAIMCRTQVEDVVVGSSTVLQDGSTVESLSKVTAGEKITAAGVKVSATELDATSVQVDAMCDPGSPKGPNSGGYGPGDPKGGHHS